MGTASSYGLEEPRFGSQQEYVNSPFLQHVQTGCEVQPAGLEWPGLETDHSPTATPQVKKEYGV